MKSPWRFVAGLVFRRSVNTDAHDADTTIALSPAGGSDLENDTTESAVEVHHLHDVTDHVETDADNRGSIRRRDDLNADNSRAAPKPSAVIGIDARVAKGRATSQSSSTSSKEVDVHDGNSVEEAGLLDREIQHLRAQLAEKLRIQNRQLAELLTRYD